MHGCGRARLCGVSQQVFPRREGTEKSGVRGGRRGHRTHEPPPTQLPQAGPRHTEEPPLLGFLWDFAPSRGGDSSPHHGAGPEGLRGHTRSMGGWASPGHQPGLGKSQFLLVITATRRQEPLAPPGKVGHLRVTGGDSWGPGEGTGCPFPSGNNVFLRCFSRLFSKGSSVPQRRLAVPKAGCRV